MGGSDVCIVCTLKSLLLSLFINQRCLLRPCRKSGDLCSTYNVVVWVHKVVNYTTSPPSTHFPFSTDIKHVGTDVTCLLPHAWYLSHKDTLCTTAVLWLAKQDQALTMPHLVFQYSDRRELVCWKLQCRLCTHHSKLCTLHSHQFCTGPVKMQTAAQFSGSVSHPNNTFPHTRTFHHAAVSFTLHSMISLTIAYNSMCVIFHVSVLFWCFMATVKLPFTVTNAAVKRCVAVWLQLMLLCIQSSQNKLHSFFIDQIMAHTGVQRKLLPLCDKV